MNVLSVAYPLAPVGFDVAGGSEQVLALLDRALTRRGDASVVIACEGSRVEGELIAMPLPQGKLDGQREALEALYRRAIRDLIARRTFDIVHMHGLDFHACLPPPGPPVLVTLHLPPDWYPPGIFSLSRPRTFLNCVSATQHAACPSSAILLPPVPNGVPFDGLRTHCRKRNYALALGRICPEKGYHIALDAAAIAGVPLVIAGEIFHYEAHDRYFRDEVAPRLNGAARFIGPVGFTRKRRLLAGARCLLVPSLAPETSSLVSMEALACGTPPIAYTSGALSEIVEHGQTGFLVNSVEEMADAIRRSGEIDPDVCRRAARRRFSADRMIADYFGLYDMLTRAEEVSCYSVGRSH